jgi:integrase
MGVYITPRNTKSGRRFIVRYRMGGRGFPLHHAGSFLTQREAKIRRDLIAGEMAAGRNPQDKLQELRTPPELIKVETLAELGERFMTSRIDLDPKTEKNHRSALMRVNAWGGERDYTKLTFANCQEFVGTLVNGDDDAEVKPTRPGTTRKYFNVFAQELDFAGLEPNPARDKRVKLPTLVEEEPEPPTAKQFLAILDNLSSPKWLLPLVTQEQTGMHVGEIITLTWGDVDVAESRFRLRYKNVKGRIRARARMVQVPDWLMSAIEETCPLEDRVAERKVFRGLNDDAARHAMANACKTAGIPHFTPKSLRHRRATIWHHNGVVAKVLAERLGHTKATMSLDVYSHVLDPGEVETQELQARVGITR